MEMSVLVLAFTRYHVIDQVEQIQRNMEADARTRYQDRLQKEQDRFKPAPAKEARPSIKEAPIAKNEPVKK